MGRSDPATQRPRRGPRAAAGWIVAGILAVALGAFVAFEAGKRSRSDASPATREPAAAAVPAPSGPPPAPTSVPESAAVDRASPQPPELHLESAVMVVTIPRPPPTRELASAPTAEPVPAQVETMREKMARCLTLEVVDDLLHSTVPRETSTQVRVSVRNSCSFSFVGPDVWYEVRAIPRRGGGTGARKVGRFNGGPIEPKSRAELVDVLECPACYEESYLYEARLWWGSSDGRTE